MLRTQAAAQLERAIESELLERLQKGVYPEGIYNFPEKQYNKALGKAGTDQEVDDGEEEEEAEDEEDVEYVEDLEEGDSDVDDMEDWEKDLEAQMAAEGYKSPFAAPTRKTGKGVFLVRFPAAPMLTVLPRAQAHAWRSSTKKRPNQLQRLSQSLLRGSWYGRHGVSACVETSCLNVSTQVTSNEWL